MDIQTSEIRKIEKNCVLVVVQASKNVNRRQIVFHVTFTCLGIINQPCVFTRKLDK